MHRGMPYPVARAGTNVALRHLSTSLVMEEMYRGTPVIYVDFTDYDEIAHHSGPERGETLDALDGVDRVVKSIVRAAEDTPRPYQFILLSDHGQSLGSTFLQRYGKTLQQLIGELMGGQVPTISATDLAERWGPLNAALSEAAQTGGATGAITRAATRGATEDGVVTLGQDDTGIEGDAGKAAAAPEHPELAVAASGNLALVFFPRMPGRVTLEQLEAAYPGMVRALATHEGVGLVMVRSEANGTVVLGHEGAHYLADDRIDGTDPVTRYGEHALEGLRRVDGMEHCGDLVCISLLDDETDEVAAFEELIGSHGGLGGAQTHPFILHPVEWTVDEEIVGAEAVYRQIRRWLSGVGIELGAQKRGSGPRPAPAQAPVPQGEPAA